MVSINNLRKLYFQTRNFIKAKQPATKITGTVASPSSPSVKLTAFEEPTITNK